MSKPKQPKYEILPAVKEEKLSPSTTRTGIFEEGRDKLGRPYEKKLDTTGLYTKRETLKDGTEKVTIKKKP